MGEKYVILGHGSFNPESGSYAPEVLVPTDTTLHFYSDAGQKLVLPSKDYDKVADMWGQLHDEGSGLEAGKVTYNFALYPDATEEHRESAKAADWGGASVVFISSGTTYLCHGTADTCPTPALHVEAKENDVADERWQHHCDGILGQLGGKGNELHWIACTSFSVRTPAIPVLEQSGVRGPGTEEDVNWIPKNDDYAAIAEKNAAAVKATNDGESVAIVAGGAVVLIGGGHLRRPADYVRRQSDIEEGALWVNKGGRFSRGSLEVEGISGKQRLVKDAIAQFSEKKVTFI
jgi:hypothetical protein